MKLLVILLASLSVLGVLGLLVFVYVVQDVEQPQYVVVLSDGAFEVRDYPALVVAEVRRGGSRQQGLRAGFGPLARYIFAKDRGGEQRIAMTAPVVQQPIAPDQRIAMTAPVTQTRVEDEWAIRFVMPSTYRLADLPAPAGTDVRLIETPPRRVAVVRFSGRTNDVLIAQQEQALRQWMATLGLANSGPPLYAYYNDPFTPGFMRRNEVMIDISED